MKQVLVFIFALLLTGCANAQSVSIHKLDLTGCSLPPIRHITDMKISGDTLLFVYETEDGLNRNAMLLTSAPILGRLMAVTMLPICHTHSLTMPAIFG